MLQLYHAPGADQGDRRCAALVRTVKMCKISLMEREQVIAALRANEQEFRAAGIVSVSLFGSVARGENPTHDVDVVVRLGANFSERGLDYISRLDDLEQRLSGILGCKVDVVEEPVRKQRFQREIDRDRALAF
jgi:hypothetical protein